MATRLSDRGFVEALFRENESDLKSYIKGKLGNTRAVDVDDIVQEAFLRIAVQDESERPANPRGFLFRIARNLVFDISRRSKVRRAYAEARAAEYASNSETWTYRSAEQKVSVREDLGIILQAVDDLPPQCRKVFLMQRRDGLSYAQIADLLGISQSMVQKHMSKALVRLNEVLP